MTRRQHGKQRRRPLWSRGDRQDADSGQVVVLRIGARQDNPVLRAELLGNNDVAADFEAVVREML